MNSRAIEEEALELPVGRRATLAQRLIESLDDLSEPESHKLWRVEAVRRADEIDAGKVRFVKPEELERRVQARLK